MQSTFQWWSEAASHIDILNFGEYALMADFINTRTAQERSQSAAVSARSGPGFKRVYLVDFSSARITVEGNVSQSDAQVAVGDFISFWSCSSPSHPQSCLDCVGQILAIHDFRPGYIRFAVRAAQSGVQRTLYLSMPRQTVHLKPWTSSRYILVTMTQRLSGK